MSAPIHQSLEVCNHLRIKVTCPRCVKLSTHSLHPVVVPSVAVLYVAKDSIECDPFWAQCGPTELNLLDWEIIPWGMEEPAELRRKAEQTFADAAAADAAATAAATSGF